MDITRWLKALEDTRLADGIRHSLYAFPLLESLHVMALSVVFGTIIIVDLRLLGLASTRRPVTRVTAELLRWTWSAFAAAAVTGALMFLTNARVYANNTSFRVKMLLLALAGLNMIIFHRTALRTIARWDRDSATPGASKSAAALSMVLWVGIIVAGRVIGFTTTGAEAKAAPPSIENFDDFLSGAADGAAPTQTGATARAAHDDAANLTIKVLMDTLVDPSGDFLFESVEDIADERGITHKAPQTAEDWAAVRHHLQVLMDAPALLDVPGRRAAEPTDRSRNPASESQPEEIQRLLDGQHADFVLRAERLRQAAAVGMDAANARDLKALFAAISLIDKACESCHLHYWYPNDERAHQAAKEEGGILE
jgi:hypothetical protein